MSDRSMAVPVGLEHDAIVDAADFRAVNAYPWVVQVVHGKYVYAKARIEGRPVLMHRFLLDEPEGKVVDHINGNTLDNRRCNLRVVGRSESMGKRATNRNSATGVKGVMPVKGRPGFYRAAVVKNGKRTSKNFRDLAAASEWIEAERARAFPAPAHRGEA